MKKTNVLFLGILVAVSFLACQKDDEPIYIRPDTSAEWLRDGSSWILKEARSKTNNGEWTSFFDNITACQRDNVIAFPTDSTYNITEGNTKCNPNDPDKIRSGRFELRDQETQIFFTDTTIIFNPPPIPNDTIYTYNYETILSITQNDFTFVNIDTVGNGDIITTERKYFIHK